MPDLNEPDAQDAALAFGLLCVVIAFLGGGLSDDPALTLKADGIMALLGTFFLIYRARPDRTRFGDLMPIQLRQNEPKPRPVVTARSHAHLWFAQWMAALSIAALASSLYVAA